MRWAALAGVALCAAALAADEPAPRDFAWRATLETAGPGGLVRVALPGDALARLQSADAADVRIFDARGRAVAFAFSAPALPAEPPRAQTQALPALPLYAADANARTGAGTLHMRITQDGQQQSVWVDLGKASGEPPAGARRLEAALFDTRALKDPLSGLVLRARVPPNTPVRVRVETSPDLAHWTPVAVQGRIFRFDGVDAPANDRLEFEPPVRLEDRYLRLDWTGQASVAVDAVVGLLPHAQPEAHRPGVTLPEPFAEGPTALEWRLGFATPLRRLQLATAQPDTLVPVRVLGRNQASEPWRLLASTVVYRIGTDEGATNPPVDLGRPSVRWLRVEATHGTRLQGLPLTAQVQFEPLELVFVAGAAAPYQLVAGRAATPGAALPLGVLSATTRTPVAQLPSARILAIESAPAAPAPWWGRWLPRGVDAKTAGLWLVLALGVLLLGGVAWSLLRQLDRKPG